MTIQRWAQNGGMTTEPDGEWVKWEDMEAYLEAARKENAILNRMVELMAKKGGASYQYYRAEAEKEEYGNER